MSNVTFPRSARRFILFLCVFFSVSGWAQCDDSRRVSLFVSVIQDPPVFASRSGITHLIDFAKKNRVTILFVQVYRANKAWFPSRFADTSPYQESMRKVSEDPLALIIQQAHAAHIQVYAWLNILSLSANKDSIILKKYGNGILTKNLKEKKTLVDYKIDGQYFLEPGDIQVRRELSAITEEVLCAYPQLDGIQFDYIRYPDRNPAYGYTTDNIERFKKATGTTVVDEGSQSWQNWKRTQVTEFLKILVKKSRAIHPDISIAATGCMPYSRAYYEAFQDWASWLKDGLVDYVTIMSYSPDPLEFEKWISVIKKKVNDFKKVNIGLGAYKVVHAPEVFRKEFSLCEKAAGNSCAVFHYGSFLENPALGYVISGDSAKRRTCFKPKHLPGRR